MAADQRRRAKPTPRRTAKPSPRPRTRRWFRRIFLTGFLLALLAAGGFALAVLITPVPDPNEVARTEATVVYYSEIGRAHV